MSTEFDIVFARLKEILRKYSGSFSVKPDTNNKFCLYGKIGPATLKAWGGNMKKPAMPVAWIEIGKAYVSYHLMGMYGNTKLQEAKKLHNKVKPYYDNKQIWWF